MIRFWQILRINIAIFYLYLLGETFYRWDGFRYYGSFMEFIPSIALVTVFWGFATTFIALMLWLPIKVFEIISIRRGWMIRTNDLLSFVYVFLLLVPVTWASKVLLLGDMQISLNIKVLVVLTVVLLSIFLTWLFRDYTQRYINNLQERITPIVWLFCIWTVISIPIVAFSLMKETSMDASGAAARSSMANQESRNIILITYDALTARDMSVYGYHRLTTPFMNEWSKKASLFTRVEAESNFTSPTNASLMTGKRLWTHQTYHHYSPIHERAASENLPLMLQSHGYTTMAFVVNPAASPEISGIHQSFNINMRPVELVELISMFRGGGQVQFGVIDAILYRLFADKIKFHYWITQIQPVSNLVASLFPVDLSRTSVPPRKAFEKFLEIINSSDSRPYFAWIHVLPPHDPYLPPEPYKGMFGSLSETGVGKSRVSYDQFIRYCDKQTEEFIEQLKIENKLKNTVIILSSDHGESFEHDYIGHAGSHLYEQVTHIPLIIKEPGQKEGKVINDIVEQIDIPATILDLAGIPAPSWMEGRTVVPLMRGEALPPKIAFSMNFQKNQSMGNKITTGTIALWKDDYKLIHYIDDNKSLLFDLKHDPGELNNLWDKENETGRYLLDLILKELEKANNRITNMD